MSFRRKQFERKKQFKKKGRNVPRTLDHEFGYVVPPIGNITKSDWNTFYDAREKSTRDARSVGDCQ